MNTSTTPSTPLPETRDERARSRWWLWPLGAILLFATWLASIYFAGHDNVLAEATLPDGTILRLEEVTSGKTQTFFVQKKLPEPFSQLGLGPHEISTYFEPGEEFSRIGVWLTRRDPATGAPLDLDWLSHCVAIDADAWEHPSGFVGRCHWDDPIARARLQEALVRDAAPFKALPAGKYREIVVGAFLPLFEPRDSRFSVQVFNTAGEIVATFDAPYPADPPTRPEWTPVSLPASQSAGDLTVTLERIDWTPQPADPSLADKRLPTWKISPTVSINWQGQPSDDWRFVSENILAVEDGLGMLSYLDRCRLTPHVPAWRLGFLLIRKPDGRYLPHEEWDPGPIELPADGESRELPLTAEIGGVPVRFLRVCAPGKHAFTVAIPSSRAVLGDSPPYSKEGTGWKTTVDHRPGFADWTVETSQPALVWQLDWDTPGRRIPFSRVFDASDTQLEVDEFTDYGYEQVTHLAFLKSSPPSGVITLKPTIYESRSVYFLIQPPRESQITATTSSGG